MKNPLTRRIGRELKEKPGKYLALFLFLTLSITLVSGFLEADNSIRTAYSSSFSRDRIEDGHFITAQPLTAGTLRRIRAQHVQTEAMYYKQAVRQKTSGKSIPGKTQTWRVFRTRSVLNKQEVFSGSLPKNSRQIAVDRCYASYHNLKPGDKVRISGQSFTISALIALPDYSALFKNNTDMVFDAENFNVALVTPAGFRRLKSLSTVYCRSWRYDSCSLTQSEKNRTDRKIMRILASSSVVTDLLKVKDNTAIQFTGEDMGSDKGMMTVMLYLVIAILAFIQAVTTRNTMENEASAVGTLRASGYSRGELLRHYLCLPLLVTLAAAALGTLLGFTCMQKYMAGSYYRSYSLVPYKPLFSWDAFFRTTAVPCLIVLAVTALVLFLTLRLPPLQFLRHDFHRRTSSRNAVPLPAWPFLRRLRIRVILHNKAAYAAMFTGIFFSCVLLAFGTSLSPMLHHYRSEILNTKIADYQYVLKAPVPTVSRSAEKYAVTSLRWNGSSGRKEDFTIYGISSGSSYLPDIVRRLSKAPRTRGSVLVSDGIMKKYNLKSGDKIRLKEKYRSKTYTFTIRGTKTYPAAMAVFMTRTDFNRTFGHTSGWFNGYFSNRKLTDLGQAVSSTITRQDLTLLADQMELSVGGIMPVFSGFAMLMYLIILYLLIRQVIERNSASISMMKVLGYEDPEISGIYNRASGIAALFSLLVSLCLSGPVLRLMYRTAMDDMNGWLEYYMPDRMYLFLTAAGILSYLVIAQLEKRRIGRIPISQVLKNNSE